MFMLAEASRSYFFFFAAFFFAGAFLAAFFLVAFFIRVILPFLHLVAHTIQLWRLCPLYKVVSIACQEKNASWGPHRTGLVDALEPENALL
jgi:hypothetical protein